jgi:murein L,D-transpeptidase YcbB/YkuD
LQLKLGVDADGIFGPGTEAALIQYQNDNGLSPDGIAGPDTFTAMGLLELVLLHRPIRGEQVRKLQEALGLPADGVFGPATEAAVKKLQEENGLEPDGMAGPQTLAYVPGFNIEPQTVEASLISESTPMVEPEKIEEAKANIEPPPHENTVMSVIKTVLDAPQAIGRSIWGTVKSIF